MAFSLLRKVNEKVLNSVSLLDASLDVDYIIADINNSINNNDIDKIENRINSLIEFSEKNKNALILQREWIKVVFHIIKWMGNNINKQIFGNILQLIIKMIEDNKNNNLLIECCNNNELINNYKELKIENIKIIEEIIDISKGGILLLETLNHLKYEKTDIYIKYDIIKILCIIKKSNLGNIKLDEIILSQGDNIGLLIELLCDGLNNHSYYLQSSLELLMLITKTNNEVQKMITYNDSIEKIINILLDEIKIFNKKDNYIEFTRCDNIMDIFLDIKENKLELDSNILIIQMCIEIIYHITKSNNCLKYLIESEINENKKFIEIIIELLGYCCLFLEYNIYEYENNRRNIINNDIELNNEENNILINLIKKIFDILINYLEINKSINDKIIKIIIDILFCTYTSIFQYKFGLLDKTIELLNKIDINDHLNFEWCTLMCISGLNITIWYGYNKIILDYKPTINYITENNKIDNNDHINEILELKDKYMNQMENTLLEWLGNIIMPKYISINELIKRDNWLFNKLINTRFRLFSFEKLYLNKNILLKDFILLCFWFPITEYQRLSNKSYFLKLYDQLSINIDNIMDDNDNNILLTSLFHYRLFRLFQLMQILLFNNNIELKEDIDIKDITIIINEIWNSKMNNNGIDNNNNNVHVDNGINNNIKLNRSFNIEFINKIIDIGKLIINDINEILNNEYENKFMEFINNYGINNNLDNFNSITTLIQIIILLILYNSDEIEFEILSLFLEDMKKLDNNIRNKMNNNQYNLLTDMISIFLFRFGIIKNMNLLNKINKRLRTNKYNDRILIKHCYILILNRINNINKVGIYNNDHFNYDNNHDNNIQNNMHVNNNNNDNNTQDNINNINNELFKSNIDNNLDKDTMNCVNCIYLNEKLYNERKKLIRIIKKKQEEINILVKAYIESQDALKMKNNNNNNNNNNNEDNDRNQLKDTLSINSSDYYCLLEIIGILERKFPFIKKFIDNNFIISSEIKSELSSIKETNIIDNIEYELLTDSEEINYDNYESKNSSKIFEDEKYMFNFQ